MIRSFLIAALAVTCFGMPAMARTSDQTTIVHAADLDLHRAQDIKRLNHRITRAASAACGPVSSLEPAGMNAKSRCIRDTVVAARTQRDAVIRRRTDTQQASAQ